MAVEVVPRVLEVLLLCLALRVKHTLSRTRERLHSTTYLLDAVHCRLLRELADGHKGRRNGARPRDGSPCGADGKTGPGLRRQLARPGKVGGLVPLLLNQPLVIDIALDDLADCTNGAKRCDPLLHSATLISLRPIPVTATRVNLIVVEVVHAHRVRIRDRIIGIVKSRSLGPRVNDRVDTVDVLALGISGERSITGENLPGVRHVGRRRHIPRLFADQHALLRDEGRLVFGAIEEAQRLWGYVLLIVQGCRFFKSEGRQWRNLLLLVGLN